MYFHRIRMASLVHFDPLQDVHAEVRFGLVWAGENRHSQRKDSSRRAQVG